MSKLSVTLAVKDMEKSIAFYTQTLGFENTFKMADPDGNLVHAELEWKNIHLMIGPTTWLSEELIACRGAGVGLYILVGEVDDIDQYYAMVKGKGANMVEDITDQFWGDRSFSLKDPDGYQLTFAKTLREVSLEEMMEAMKQMAYISPRREHWLFDQRSPSLFTFSSIHSPQRSGRPTLPGRLLLKLSPV